MNLQSIKQRFGIIGNAPALIHAIGIADRVALTNLSVLITGESGVGKEVFSQIIHQLSARKHNQFIAINCGAIPEGTIDSELFGHEKGAFTGAQDKRKGYFETVDGGTIFLDEIGEMPVGTQARLLRVLESGEFIKVGSSKPQKTDVRVIAATNVNLIDNVKNGKFREDLYYRLSTVPIEIPALRERGEDALLLFRKFASDFAEKNRRQTVRLNEEAQKVLLKYSWPGNVRQLKNVAEQVSILANDNLVTGEELVKFIPDIQRTRLPALFDEQNGSSNNYSERELLYKMLFDIKKDVTDMKQFIFEMTGNQNIPHFTPGEGDSRRFMANSGLPSHTAQQQNVVDYSTQPTDNHAVLLNKDEYQEAETEEESLSIADKEKELIIKALKKHRSKRKDAAADLGISERTLYRKIKEYEINE